MKKILFFILITISSVGYSQDKALKIEPLYGVETAWVRFPEPSRYVTRAVMGMRAIYGAPLLSGELEYTKSESRQDYPSDSSVVRDRMDRFNFGARSTFNLGQWLSLYARGGLSYSYGKTIISKNGVDSHDGNPSTLSPYAGGGALITLGNVFSLNAGITLIKNSANQYDRQYTLGLNTHFGNY